MILAAIPLFQREGYAAASWRRLVQESGAPWGSAHHYFPNGKEQLAAAALELAAREVAAFFALCFTDGGDAGDAVRELFSRTATRLAKSDFAAGCPVCGVALETAAQSAKMREACEGAFSLWRATLAAGLARCGVASETARLLAFTILAAFEGALVQARVARSEEPLRVCADAMARLCANLAD